MDDDFEIAHHRASVLFQEGKYEEAEPILTRLMAYRPQGFPDIFNKLGFIYQWRGDLPKAAEHFRKALELNPRYTEAALNLAVTLIEMGEYEQARTTFSNAAKQIQSETASLDPYIRGKMANEHARLGDYYYALGLYDEALEEYRKALRMRPNLVDIVTKIGIALREKGELDEAIRMFMTAKEIHPKYSQAIIHLGITYYIKGFFSLAKSEWASLQDVTPQGHSAALYFALAQKGLV